MSVNSAINQGYDKTMKFFDNLNADQLSNRLVELGYNTGLGRAGGVLAGGVGVVGGATATALI